MFLTTPRSTLPSAERLERRLLLLGVLLFEEDLARQHDVAALLVDLDHAHPELLPLERVEVAHRTHVDLAAGQERADADVHREAALDPLDDAADDDFAFGKGALDLVPDLHLLGLLARQHDVAFAVFGALEQHVDHVSFANDHLAGFVEKLVDRDDAFGLVADVDHDFVGGDFENRALDDFTFREIAEAVIVKVQQAGILLRIGLVVMAPGGDRFGGRLARWPWAAGVWAPDGSVAGFCSSCEIAIAMHVLLLSDLPVGCERGPAPRVTNRRYDT